MAARAKGECIFCKIARGEEPAPEVFSDEKTIAFLDHRPLFPGHVLLIPKSHYQTLPELPAALIEPLFSNAQRLAAAVEQALQAEGSFVALNNRVSQSIPHLHIHIVPRRKKDGLRGFFWPRHHYKNTEEIAAVQKAIKAALKTARG